MRVLLLAWCLMTASPMARADTWNATYDAYVAGANALRLTAAIEVGAAGYRMDVRARTVGMLDLLVGSRQSIQVEGGWHGALPRPRQFQAEGLWKGERRATAIDFHAGLPTIRHLVPADPSREAVPGPARQDALDRLSPMMLLARQMMRTGRCEASATTFDGRLLEEITARTGGWEELSAGYGGIFAGRALRCEIGLRVTAGFKPDEDRAHAGRMRRAEVWIAVPAEGALMMPVRFKLDIGWLGSANVILSGLERTAGP